MYESNLVEVPDIGEFLDTLNEINAKIVSVTFLSDSQQLLVIYYADMKEVKVPGWLNE